jgi:D-alanyl-D-alanine carboxypeptidase/D-alanyl-D-alanine-endopeptidase (penicillin-binding protein 4)
MIIRILAIIAMSISLLFGDLASQIEEKIETSGIAKDNLSISIKETGASGKKIIGLHEYTLRVPASVLKVPTTFAALLELGENFRWKTEFYIDGSISSGVLRGNLIVKGGGDPALDTNDVKNIVSKLKLVGLRAITGNIIIDRNYFEPSEKSSAYFDENPYSPYNAMPDAMMFNQNTTTLNIDGNCIDCEVDDKSFDIENNINTQSNRCDWPHVRIIDSSRPKVVISGNIAQGCGTKKITKIISRSYQSFYYSLKENFLKNGVEFNEQLVLGTTPEGSRKIFTHYSKPLLEIVGETNKDSNNLFARQIFLTLGAQLIGSPGNLEKSAKAIRQILYKNGISNVDMLHIENGSGLSRTARASTIVFEEMLEIAYARFGYKWLNTLSVSGVDGTIKTRFPSSMRNMIWMKTGTVKNAKNIVGYVRSNNGKLYTVAIFANGPDAKSSGFRLENEIIKLLVDSSDSSDHETKKVSIYSKQIGDGRYFIQVGSFASNMDNALEKKLKYLKYDYKIIANGGIKKILVGPYITKDNAFSDIDDLREHVNPEAFIVAQ